MKKIITLLTLTTLILTGCNTSATTPETPKSDIISPTTDDTDENAASTDHSTDENHQKDIDHNGNWDHSTSTREADLVTPEQIPILLAYDGRWVNCYGDCLELRTQASLFFEKYPEYRDLLLEVCREFDEELSVDSYEYYLARIVSWQNPNDATADNDFGILPSDVNTDWLRAQITNLLADEEVYYTLILNPANPQTYVTYCQRRGITPDRIPLCLDFETGEWIDQFGAILTAAESEAWFDQHPLYRKAQDQLNEVWASDSLDYRQAKVTSEFGRCFFKSRQGWNDNIDESDSWMISMIHRIRHQHIENRMLYEKTLRIINEEEEHSSPQ